MGLMDRLFKQEPQTLRCRLDPPRSEAERHPVVNLEEVEFLTPIAIIEQNAVTDDLMPLIFAIESSLRESLAECEKAFVLRIRCTIYPDRPVGIDMAAKIPMDRSEVWGAYEALNRLDAVQLRARREPVRLQANFDITPRGIREKRANQTDA